jgi:hypothetical protein
MESLDKEARVAALEQRITESLARLRDLADTAPLTITSEFLAALDRGFAQMLGRNSAQAEARDDAFRQVFDMLAAAADTLLAAAELGTGPIFARSRWKARQRLVRLIARRARTT